MKKFAAVVSFIFSITSITATKINQIEGVQGEILITRFDSSSNLYIVSSEPSLRLYKLDPEKNVVWKEWIYDPVEALHVTNQGHVYLIQSIESDDNYRSNITLIPSGTRNFIQVDLTKVNGTHFLEDGAYLFYDGSDSNVKFLKQGEKVPIPVKNLDGFSLETPHAYNMDGDVYLTGWYENGTRALIELSNDTLQEDAPEAVTVFGVYEDPAIELIVDLTMDERNNLLISKSNVLGTGDILKYDGVEPPYSVVTNLLFLPQKVKTVKDRTLVLLTNVYENRCSLHYLTPDYKFLSVLNLLNLVDGPCYSLQFADDANGNVFLAAYGTLETSSLELLKAGEPQSTTINIKGTNPIIVKILLDRNGVLWVVLDDGSFYKVDSGSVDATRVPEAEKLKIVGLRENKKNGEIIVETNDGLYVLTN